MVPAARACSPRLIWFWRGDHVTYGQQYNVGSNDMVKPSEISAREQDRKALAYGLCTVLIIALIPGETIHPATLLGLAPIIPGVLLKQRPLIPVSPD